MIVCVEGCNAVGKSHALAQFGQRLESLGISYRVYKAPDYQGVHGADITNFLAGKALSGQYMYESAQLSEDEKQRAFQDFKDVDVMFKLNREDVFRRIQEDQRREPVDVILLDRWILSAVVYSAMRFQDIGMPMDNEYFDSIVEGERMPDVTLIIEEPAEVIVSRMQYRLDKLQGPAPKVWQQSAECYDRIMGVFRTMHTYYYSMYNHKVTSQTIGEQLDQLAASISCKPVPKLGLSPSERVGSAVRQKDPAFIHPLQ